MARQQTADRNIPHLRDIFGFGNKWENARMQAEEKAAGHDSAVSIGSTSGEEESPKNSKKKKTRRRDNSKTLTESDVKHLERHLSMKKTIRKKIMRDLQQAFVEDPNEFRVDDIPPEQLKAEINIQSLSFGTPSQKQGRTRGNAESTFLDMLRAGGGLEKMVQTVIGILDTVVRQQEKHLVPKIPMMNVAIAMTLQQRCLRKRAATFGDVLL